MKVVCVGHSTYDTTLPMDTYPTENVKYRIGKHIECGGGPASNGAYLLAKWGLDVAIASVIGKDYYGDRIIDDFTKIGADTKYLEQREDHYTSSSFIIANMSNGSRTIITSKKNPVRKLASEVDEKADLILIDGEHPETAYEVLEKNPNAVSVLDAGRLNEDTKFLGKKVSYVVCSKDFAEEFSQLKITNPLNIKTLIEIYESLKAYFNTNIIITLEASGSFTKIDDNYEVIPSVKVKAIDSTGAGDIFHGAFTYFIGKQYPLREAIRLASITGAISVTRIGSRYSIPDLAEVLDYDLVI
ncbi:MAG: carbohydrate kinase family protein [Bacilli bacterium]|nr:carbohydrate kinase family protein [Bacilli bacterium]